MTIKMQHQPVQRSFIEVFQNDQWIAAASIQFLAMDRCRLDYLIEYAFSDKSKPVAIGFPLDWNPDKVEKNELNVGSGMDPSADYSVPSFLYDLVPQGQGRKFLLQTLGLHDSDKMILPLIAAGAFNPIGNLRIRSAVEFFQKYKEQHPENQKFNGLTLKEITEHSNIFLDHISPYAMLASGTTGVQGVAPKFLLTQDQSGKWHADLSLKDEDSHTHWLVKLPRGSSGIDRLILENEAAYLRVANQCGIRSNHPPMLIDNKLFVRRFDRDVEEVNGINKVHRLHQESLASLAGLKGFAVPTSQNRLLQALREAVTDPLGETIEFIKRDILNLALRNTDNHARNTAIQTTFSGEVRLTPIFDFAPMFMDPEVIPRSIHWINSDGKRAGNWNEVLKSFEHIGITHTDLVKITTAIQEFSEVIGHLPGIARECGVDSGTLDKCSRSIQDQLNQIESIENFEVNRRG